MLYSPFVPVVNDFQNVLPKPLQECFVLCIVADDAKYEAFLERFRKNILKIVDDWDEWRIKHREEGDPENPRLSKKERASRGLYGAVSNEYGLSKGSTNRDKVAGWVGELSGDAV